MNVLITGGFGFIGAHVVERFKKEKHSITVIDDASTIPVDGLDKGLQIYHLAAADQKCAKVFAATHFDLVIHLTAADDGQHLRDRQVLVDDHSALNNILHLAEKYKAGKVIVLSHYPVYGRQNNLPSTEEAQLTPGEPAGLHFLTRETICNEYRSHGLTVVILRVGVVYGPRQSDSQTLLSRLLAAGEIDATLALEIKAPRKQDYIFVNDLVEAIYRVGENQTSHVYNISGGQEVTNMDLWRICAAQLTSLGKLPETDEAVAGNANAADFVLDNHKARMELEWSPKYSLEDGIAKTIAWAGQAVESADGLSGDQAIKRVTPGKRRFVPGSLNRDLESVVLFIVFALFNYLLAYKMGISADLFLLYIIIVSAFYGLRQSLTAFALSSMAFIWSKFNFEGIQAFKLIGDVNTILYLTIYFLIGIGTGYMVDKLRQDNKALAEELSFAQSEVDFISEVYQKCLEVKNSMQYMLENYENNFGAIFNVVTKLNRVAPELIFHETALIFSRIFKAKNVNIYYVSRNHDWLRLVASVGAVKHGRSIKINRYDFLAGVINKQETYINKSLEKEHPLICVPVFVDHSTKAAVFLDDVEFTHLNQHFTNLLKTMIYLISSTIARAHQYEEITGEIKFFPRTMIMKQQWFNNLVKYYQQRQNETGEPFALLIVNDVQRSAYEGLSEKIRGLLRELDYIGEIKEGQLGIMISNVDQDGILSIKDRLTKNEIAAVVTKLEGLHT